MASCKDCLYVDVCEDITRIKLSPSRAKEILPILRERGKTCEQFKDRSRFVELPCKHGDTLFRIKNGKIEKGIATTFFYGSDFQIVNCRFPKISTGIPFHRFGKTVFLTKEQAEQALLKESVRVNDTTGSKRNY